MTQKFIAALIVVPLAVLAWQVRGDPDASGTIDNGPVAETIKERLSEVGKVEEVTPIPGIRLYRVRIGSEYFYVTGDGRYLLSGDLYDLREQRNLTEDAMAEHRRSRLARIDPEEAVVFEAEGETAGTVWVFTDVDCPYCRHFHQQIDAYNRLGIEVRYLAYPRAGPGSKGWRRAEAVWCSADRRAALTRAKTDKKITAETDCDTGVVRRHYETARELGIRGTPMIVAIDGRRLGGYLSPEQLLAKLEKKADGG